MTDLFDSLSSRFTPGAQPAIRPRPQARYEGVDSADPLVEEDVLETVRAPQNPSAAPRSRGADQPLAPKQSAPAASENQASHPMSPRNRRTPDRDRNAAPTPLEQNANTRPGDTPQPIRSARAEPPQTPRDGAEPKSQRMPSRTGQSDHPTDKTREIIRERGADTPRKKVEVSRQQIETRILQIPSEEPAEPAKRAPQQEKTTIRIGRVEMRQPAPPAPAPTPAPPPRRAAPTGAKPATNGGARGTSGSGLTDYLGWKRR